MERDFKGIWIPKEIWLDERLNALDKIILMEIHSLDNEEGCYASNKYLAEFCQCSEVKISKSIALLIKLGYVKVKSFDGRKRFLKTCLVKNTRLVKNISQPCKKYKADLKKVKDNNIYNNIDNNNDNNKLLSLEQAPQTYGNEQINKMFSEWEKRFGYKPKNSVGARRAIYNMLRAKDKGEVWLLKTMDILLEAQKDKYAGNAVLGIANFDDLQRNYDKVWKWGSMKYHQSQDNQGYIDLNML